MEGPEGRTLRLGVSSDASRSALLAPDLAVSVRATGIAEKGSYAVFTFGMRFGAPAGADVARFEASIPVEPCS